jgi:hypothetical protein
MPKVEQVDAVYTKYVMFPLDEAFHDLGKLRDANTLPILMGIIREIEYGNTLPRGFQKKAGDALGFSPTEVGRAVAVLVDRGVLRKTRQGEYEVDAGFCWRGSFREFQKVRDRQLKDDLQEMLDGLPDPSAVPLPGVPA